MEIISVRLKIIGSNAPRVPKITHCNVNVKYERMLALHLVIKDRTTTRNLFWNGAFGFRVIDRYTPLKFGNTLKI